MDYYFYDYDQPLYDDDEKIVFKMSEKNFYEIWTNCVYPSLQQIVSYIQKLLIWNITCRIGWIIFQEINYFTYFSAHVISIICGVCILIETISTSTWYIFIFGIISYLLLFILNYFNINRMGHIFTIICLISLAICEIIQTNAKIWHQIRGIQMIATMKAISLAFDSDLKKINRLPNIISYLGYIFCPANCILGPWITYDEYLNIFNGPKYKIKWIIWTISNIFIAILFLILSNCIVNMLTSDYSWKWFVAYRDALAFRCSHYFISFLSQATMSVSGVIVNHQQSTITTSTSTAIDEESYLFGNFITKPLNIELPRSLVKIVINWNIPMHRWLKDYIFRKMKPYSTALAIFTTYFVSSLLHGLNFQIYAVLLSLGFYTFVEYNLRYKIANIFNACILSSNCKHNCSHEYKWNTPLVLLINFILSLITIVHLAYLGLMFEASTSIQEEGYSIEHTLNKWKNLNFISHWIIIFSYAFYMLI